MINQVRDHLPTLSHTFERCLSPMRAAALHTHRSPKMWQGLPWGTSPCPAAATVGSTLHGGRPDGAGRRLKRFRSEAGARNRTQEDSPSGAGHVRLALGHDIPLHGEGPRAGHNHTVLAYSTSEARRIQALGRQPMELLKHYYYFLV